jgi:NTE family protein
MRLYGIGLCCTVLLVLPLTAPAAEDDLAPLPERPRIGLVLGGGGAKGGAHVGVLQVLDELRIPIDCVAGTSMGALIGGTFASGMPADVIEEQVLAINWSRTVGSEGLRDRTPIDRKLAGLTYTNNLEFGLKGLRLQAPGGLFKTQDIEDVIRNLVADARLTRDFDNLPIPFRAVATDMRGGEMVVLDRGDLMVALRASMAVPGAFSPVLMDGKVLADGGMMRNLPVDIARKLCADVVIAVWLTVPTPDAAELQSAVDLVGRSLDVMIDANTNAQIATLTPRDVGIEVPMGDIGSAAFDRIPDTIPLGRAAALARRAELERYAVPQAQYLAWREAVSESHATTIPLATVNIRGLNRVNPEFVRSQLRNVAPGRSVTTADITEDTGRIYALGDFERVEYRLLGPADARVLDIRPVEKSWGPHYVRIDLGLAASGNGDLKALLRADHVTTWLNERGGAWRNTVQIGQQLIAQTGLYQPLDVQQRFFVEPLTRFERRIEDVYDDGDRVARVDLREWFGQLDAGINFGTRAQLRGGLRLGVIDSSIDTGPEVVTTSGSQRESAAILRFVYDTRDAVGLPTRGTFLNTRYVHAGSWFGGEVDYDLVEGVLTQSFPWRGDSLSFILGGGAEFDGALPATEEFQLGGIRTFPGLQPGELRGDSYWFAGTSYSWKIADIQALFGQAYYAGLRLQAGRVGSPIDDNDEGTLVGLAGSLSGRSPVGPFLVSLGWVDNDSWQLQLAIGRPIPEGSILDEIR